MKYSFFTIFSLLLVSCDHNPSSTIHAEELEIYNQAAVVSARKEASDIGTTILKKGGNAFDAMIATELALAVSYPFAGNISGGGFMVYRMSDGKIGSIDYREVAPSATHKDYYLDEEGNVIFLYLSINILKEGLYELFIEKGIHIKEENKKAETKRLNNLTITDLKKILITKNISFDDKDKKSILIEKVLN